MNNASPSALPHPIVALVTDRNLAGGPDALIDAVAQAVDNGVNLVQMREKDLPDAVQLALAQRLREVTSGKALLFINDSVSIAEASGADGVQLTENSRSIASARARAARPLLVGRSVHGVEAAREAAAQGANLLVVGTVYDSPTHPGQAPAGVGLIGWCAQPGVPVVGIGGITANNAGAVMQAGASGVAVISAILGSTDPAGAASRLAAAVSTASVPFV
ncbi:MAG: thiamine phosphate synthase [Chloroflexota bacterium]|nr:thiamine phosphate synthase [Chloroflexota bacterium]MDE2884607.1 thiamine phosphate synthase [Chloroflexota bacterium]